MIFKEIIPVSEEDSLPPLPMNPQRRRCGFFLPCRKRTSGSIRHHAMGLHATIFTAA